MPRVAKLVHRPVKTRPVFRFSVWFKFFAILDLDVTAIRTALCPLFRLC